MKFSFFVCFFFFSLSRHRRGRGRGRCRVRACLCAWVSKCFGSFSHHFAMHTVAYILDLCDRCRIFVSLFWHTQHTHLFRFYLLLRILSLYSYSFVHCWASFNNNSEKCHYIWHCCSLNICVYIFRRFVCSFVSARHCASFVRFFLRSVFFLFIYLLVGWCECMLCTFIFFLRFV